MRSKIILISNRQEVTQAYQRAVEKISDVEIDTVESFADLYMALKGIHYHGVMIDLAVNTRATNAEKELIRRIKEAFPTILVKQGCSGEEVRVFPYGQLKEHLTLRDFILRECSSIQARMLRSHPRKNVTLNVILSRDNVFTEKNTVRATTINLSKGGCFIYSVEEWSISDNVWFIVNDLRDKTPVLGMIKRYCEWGTSLRFPGIGLEYQYITPAQRKELSHLVE